VIFLYHDSLLLPDGRGGRRYGVLIFITNRVSSAHRLRQRA